tara:strand:- start:118 stop:921 length:804 start_codon:yes stop_codon:yes gene_type:complete
MVELREQFFIESSIETMDKAVFNYIDSDLSLYTTRNGESEKVPIIWASAERSFQLKKQKEIRDNHETLIYPLITVYRESIERDVDNPLFVPGNNSFAIARRIMPFNTRKFANAAARKRFNVDNRKFENKKVVYETLYSENVTSVLAKYNITIKTSYLLDMNHLLNCFLTINNFREVKVVSQGHAYYMTFPLEFSFDKISENLDDAERSFETSFTVETRGALFARPENIDEAVLKTAQNAVNIQFNKERTIVGDIPAVVNGAKAFVEE